MCSSQEGFIFFPVYLALVEIYLHLNTIRVFQGWLSTQIFLLAIDRNKSLFSTRVGVIVDDILAELNALLLYMLGLGNSKPKGVIGTFICSKCYADLSLIRDRLFAYHIGGIEEPQSYPFVLDGKISCTVLCLIPLEFLHITLRSIFHFFELNISLYSLWI